jgi:hypothetical protein
MRPVRKRLDKGARPAELSSAAIDGPQILIGAELFGDITRL